LKSRGFNRERPGEAAFSPASLPQVSGGWNMDEGLKRFDAFLVLVEKPFDPRVIVGQSRRH
jgi:hypothetical protein